MVLFWDLLLQYLTIFSEALNEKLGEYEGLILWKSIFGQDFSIANHLVQYIRSLMHLVSFF